MKRFYSAVLLVIVVISCSNAALAWKRVRLESAGTISIPQSWNVLAGNPDVVENAYGPGVSCRNLLNAEGDNATMTVLVYWPYSANIAKTFASDMAETLQKRYGSSSRPRFSEMKRGTFRASSVTYGIGNGNDQKVTAFVNDGKVYCLIISYRHSEEHTFYNFVRSIITRWQF
ncbi:MAG: hypothetical protein IJG51_07975 [Synergistaceae bacterium]|nr:hypothetical protein [Synergistaceae bacterium]MBQ3346857.1 hypothetical protein [Synergistaceae bacterium]MBQ3398811.1 hypothetical protein [Synergistaceae bacterium]MBQ3758595.1 hypothetical protein [Synergistaceae bacterium]MBQ4401885.1 hypothetical protein [Synergistaceae bacterium]